jgi:hypothetical protein
LNPMAGNADRHGRLKHHASRRGVTPSPHAPHQLIRVSEMSGRCALEWLELSRRAAHSVCALVPHENTCHEIVPEL